MNGASGSTWHNTQESTKTIAQILQALEVIHSAKSPNSLRQDATRFLEKLRSEEDAPYQGFALASNPSHPAIVRHYGLSLLEHAIRHRWEGFHRDQSTTLREWVVSLAQEIKEDDPQYLSNKIAELWVEIAKRSWALDWMDMDELLVRLWEGRLARKVLVLNILETLSEDVFGHEDVTAGLRGTELNRACIDIFTPADVLRDCFPDRETNMNVRYGEEGWLTRVGTLLDWCLQENAAIDPQSMTATKALYTIKSVLVWIIPGAVIKAHSMTRVLNYLGLTVVPVQLVGILRSLMSINFLLTGNLGCH